jgi:hypothetical protein
MFSNHFARPSERVLSFLTPPVISANVKPIHEAPAFSPAAASSFQDRTMLNIEQ